jgi:hypothetical protein
MHGVVGTTLCSKFMSPRARPFFVYMPGLEEPNASSSCTVLSVLYSKIKLVCCLSGTSVLEHLDDDFGDSLFLKSAGGYNSLGRRTEVRCGLHEYLVYIHQYIASEWRIISKLSTIEGTLSRSSRSRTKWSLLLTSDRMPLRDQVATPMAVWTQRAWEAGREIRLKHGRSCLRLS